MQPMLRMYSHGMSTQEAVDLPLSLGRQMAEARRRLHISQKDMAQLLDVHRNTVGRWERGLEVPSFDVIVWLSTASGWPLALFARAMELELPWDGPDTPTGLGVTPRACNGNVVPFGPRAVVPLAVAA